MVEIDIRITAQDLYDYNLRHAYNSISGLFGSVLGAVMIIAGIYSKTWISVIGGVVLLLYLPWTLFLRSRQQMTSNPFFKESLHYMLDDDGMTISQGEISETQEWAQMYKAVSTARSIILYTAKRNATIFPKNQLGEKKTAVIEMIATHMPPSKVKIRL